MKYELHPACAAWPRPDDKTVAEMTASIKGDGVHNPIWITADNLLLDGKTRLEICETLGIEPPVSVYTGDDPEGFTVAQNARRRHLTTGALALIVAKLHERKRGGFAGNRNAAKTSTKTKVSSETLVSWAEKAGLSKTDIAAAKVVNDKATEPVAELVRNGKIGVRTAANYVRATPKAKQAADPKVIKSAPRTTQVGETERAQEARDIVRPLVQGGSTISVRDLNRKTGISRIVLEAAIAAERGHQAGLQEGRESAPVDISGLSATAQEKINRAMRQLAAQLMAGFERRVDEELQALLAHRDARDIETLQQANELLARQYQKPFTAQEYTSVLMRALHPDTSTTENRLEAFKLCNNRKLLLRAEGRIQLRGTPLPKTLEELMAAKAAAQAARKMRRANGPSANG
jgi:hypothetical protein